MLKKTLIYLGLGPDEEYELDESAGSPSPIGSVPAAPVARPDPAAQSPAARRQVVPSSGTVRPIAPGAEPTGVRTLPARETAAPGDRPRAVPSAGATSAIRIVESTTTKPHAVSPASFNEAQEIGDRFKTGQPVIINLQGVDKDLRRRLVDFSSGLCYALAGKMDRVADQVYLLTPADVEVSHDDTRLAID